MKKQNSNQRFKIERKGYNTKEVEEYLVVEGERNEAVHREQRERIDALINENQQLKKVVNEYKSKEDKIAEAIALVIESEDNVEKVQAMVAELTAKYPLC